MAKSLKIPKGESKDRKHNAITKMKRTNNNPQKHFTENKRMSNRNHTSTIKWPLSPVHWKGEVLTFPDLFGNCLLIDSLLSGIIILFFQNNMRGWNEDKGKEKQ